MPTKTKTRTRRTRSPKRGAPKPRRGAAFTARRRTRRHETAGKAAQELHEKAGESLPAPGTEEEWTT